MTDGLLGLTGHEWLIKALALNFDPAAYIHDSWLATLPHADLLRRLHNAPEASPHVSRYLSQSLNLENNYWHDFSNPLSRLALLDAQALESLFLHIGLWLRSGEIHREIRGDRIRALRRSLGEQGYIFATKRALFLGKVAEFPFEPDEDDPRLRFTLIGACFCARPLVELSIVLARRMMLKLPQPWSAHILGTPAQADEYGAQPPPLPMIRKISKETLPRWSPLFN